MTARKRRILLVGLSYTGSAIRNTEIDTLGLGREEVIKEKAAAALYDYDVIIINPETYSHFIFGREGRFSSSPKELWDLKQQNDEYDLDSVFSDNDRAAELRSALKDDARVVWLMAAEKRIHFFGWRSVYTGYVNDIAKKVMDTSTVHVKRSHKLEIAASPHPFESYFKQLQADGWRLCIDASQTAGRVLATTPDDYILGLELIIGNSLAWLLTPPTSNPASKKLIEAVLTMGTKDVPAPKFHGLFLSHASEDKPFVRKLKKDLERKGVKNIWLDEAEIMIGDSLLEKIEEGMKKTEYIGVVLSPKSVTSNWAKKELREAMTREIKSGKVIVLPLLYEKCELPAFLNDKLYGDFTSPPLYRASVKKLLRRLTVTA